MDLSKINDAHNDIHKRAVDFIELIIHLKIYGNVFFYTFKPALLAQFISS